MGNFAFAFGVPLGHLLVHKFGFRKNFMLFSFIFLIGSIALSPIFLLLPLCLMTQYPIDSLQVWPWYFLTYILFTLFLITNERSHNPIVHFSTLLSPKPLLGSVMAKSALLYYFMSAFTGILCKVNSSSTYCIFKRGLLDLEQVWYSLAALCRRYWTVIYLAHCHRSLTMHSIRNYFATILVPIIAVYMKNKIQKGINDVQYNNIDNKAIILKHIHDVFMDATNQLFFVMIILSTILLIASLSQFFFGKSRRIVAKRK